MKERHQLKRRLLSFVLTFAMLFGTVIEPIQISAAQPDTGTEAALENTPMLLAEEPEADPPVTPTISLNTQELALEVGDISTLTATVVPAGAAVTWVSGNNAIAEVTGNNASATVKAVAVGSTDITASFENNGTTYTAKATVTVSTKMYNISMAVSANNKEIDGATVYIGDKPAERVSTGVYATRCATGTYKVTAQKSGFKNYEGTVTVSTKDVREDITMSLNDVNVSIEGNTTLTVSDTTTLSAVIPEFEEKQEVTWLSSDTNIVTVDNSGVVTAVKKGMATIKATINTDFGTVSKDTVFTVNQAANTSVAIAVNPAGKDKIEQVDITATVTNTKNKKVVTKGKICFTISKLSADGLWDEVQKETIEVDKTGQTVYSLKDTTGFGLIGKYKFKADYSDGQNGEFYIPSSYSETISEDYKNVIPMKFVDENDQEITIDPKNPQEVTYGDTGYQIKVNHDSFVDTAGDIEKTDSVAYTYKVKSDGISEKVLSVNKEGNVNFLRAYEKVVYVEVTRDGIGNHAGITVDYPIRVKRKTLTIDTSCQDVTYSKIYDKTSDVFHNEDTKDTLSNLENIRLMDLVTPPNGTVADKVTVKDAKGTMPAEIIDAGKYDDVEVQYSEIVLDGDIIEDGSEEGYNLKDNYRLEVSAKKPITLKTQVTIEKRVVKLKVSDGQRQYGHYDDGVTFTGDPVNPVSENTEVYTKRDIEGIVGNDTVVYPTPVEVPITDDPDYALGSYPDKLTVYSKTATDADNGDAGNNYYFDFDDISKGTLEVVKEEINESNYRYYVDFPEDGGSVYLSKTDHNVWVNNKLTAFHMIPKSGTNYYTDVYLANAQGEPDYSISSENGIDITNLPSAKMDGATATIKVCMYNTNNGSASTPFDVKLFLDKLDPIVSKTSISEETHGLKNFLNVITFGKFHKELKDIEETVSVTDGSGSGIQRWDYNIMTGKLDNDFSKEEIEAYTAATNDECIWNEMAVRGDNEDNAKLEGTIKLPDEENNYVLLLKLKDNVGNEEIYASNGVIIDYQAPTVSIDLAREAGQFESTTGIYGEDVQLKIHVEDVVRDVNESKSAISKVDIKVVKDNDESTSTSVTLLDITTENAEEPDKPKTAWTLLDLDSYRSKDLYYTVNAKDYNSNNVTVTATVTDNAGNENSYPYALKIDTTPPIITADYTTDANGKKGSEPKNGYYYKDPMYAFITYTERNFDKTKPYLWFEVQVEGRETGKYSVEELTSELGIQTAWVELETSQDDRDAENFTDERQHKLILTFDRDDHYTFTPHMKDLAEKADSNNDPIASNEVASGEKQHFVVDQKDPIMHVVYEDADGKPISVPQEEEKRVYNGKGVRAIVTIDEHNFAIEKDGVYDDVQVDVNVGASEVEQDAKGNAIALQDYNETLKQYSAWNPQNVDTYTSTYYFGVDANYTHSITYTDLAGNEVSYAPGYFTVDKTKPTGTVKVGTLGWWDTFLEKISFGLFSASTVDVEMTGTDHTSPVRPVQYARFRNGKTKAELETYNGWSSASAETPEKAEFKVNPDEQFVVYTRVTDYAGNYEYFSSDGIIVDHTKPAPIVTVTNLSQAQNGIFNENVTLRIDAEDPTAGDTYSGLEKVWYTVSASGNVVKSETITLMDNSGNRVQGNKTFSQIITVPADVYNSNDVKVQAFATDFSGNQGDSEVTNLKIDVTAPTISVVWDLNSPLNNRYYKDTRTATVTVTDRNFDPNAVRFSITNTDGTPASIGGWSSSSNIGVSDSATTTCQVSFPADGDYTFTFGCTDLAGNSAEYGKTDEFTIDKTLPVMTVSYDNNSAKNGNYYKEARTATVTIREHNFNAADVRAAITASLEGSGIAAPSISGFSTSGDTHTATVKYDTDGDYTFDVDYTDMAGNQAADYAMDDFTVDLTAPEVDIIDIVDKSANNDTVSPAVNATDINYDMRNVTVSVIGTNNGTVEIGKVTTTIENGQNIKLNDFARTEAMDDLYKLTAKAVDLAGNETEDSVLFSVNRYGSVFVLDDSTNKEKGGWLSTKEADYTYINQEREVGVIEYNVDTIESSKITVNRDGELANLEKGTDYTVTASGSEVQWKETHYVMNADNFADEGNYTVILNTQDRASNSVNNSSVKKSTGALPIAFTVDKTAPSIVISGIENNEQYREAEKKFTVDAKDNLALKEVKVAVNDEETVYRAEDLRNAEGIVDVIEMTVGKSNSWQKIKVSASDMAGNVKEYRPLDKNGEEIEDAAMAFVSILVTPNILVQYYANKPVFYSSVAIFAVLAALIIFIIWKKKKKMNRKVRHENNM